VCVCVRRLGCEGDEAQSQHEGPSFFFLLLGRAGGRDTRRERLGFFPRGRGVQATAACGWGRGDASVTGVMI